MVMIGICHESRLLLTCMNVSGTRDPCQRLNKEERSMCKRNCTQASKIHRYLGDDVFLPPATKLGQGYVFTGVCDSVHRGGEYLTRYPHPPGTRYTPPRTRYTPPGTRKIRSTHGRYASWQWSHWDPPP